jgi:hypothetical protein
MNDPCSFEFDEPTKTLTCYVTPEQFWDMVDSRDNPNGPVRHRAAWLAIKAKYDELRHAHGPHVAIRLATVHMGANAMKRAIPA